MPGYSQTISGADCDKLGTDRMSTRVVVEDRTAAILETKQARPMLWGA